MLAAPAAAQTARALAPAQEFCGVLTQTGADTTSFVPATGYSLLNATPPLSMPAGQSNVGAIVCIRSTVFIGPHDHRVLTDLRVPLYIRDNDRIAVLEMQQGEIRVRFTRGQPTEIERQALASAIDRAYAEMRGRASGLRGTTQ